MTIVTTFYNYVILSHGP